MHLVPRLKAVPRRRLILFGCALIAVTAFFLPIRPVVITGDSMAPTLAPGQWLTMSRLERPLRRGDIVVFRYRGRTSVKRIFALGGDRFWEVVSEESDYVYRWPVDEASVAAVQRISRTRTGFRIEPVVVPPGTCYVLGDNRNNSEDSRSYGFVPVTAVMGHVTPPGSRKVASSTFAGSTFHAQRGAPALAPVVTPGTVAAASAPASSATPTATASSAATGSSAPAGARARGPMPVAF